jgi:hypothetical protein
MTVDEFKKYIAEHDKVVVYCGSNTYPPETLFGNDCFRTIVYKLGDKYKYLMLDTEGTSIHIGNHFNDVFSISYTIPIIFLYRKGVEIGRNRKGIGRKGDFTEELEYIDWINTTFENDENSQ